MVRCRDCKFVKCSGRTLIETIVLFFFCSHAPNCQLVDPDVDRVCGWWEKQLPYMDRDGMMVADEIDITPAFKEG